MLPRFAIVLLLCAGLVQAQPALLLLGQDSAGSLKSVTLDTGYVITNTQSGPALPPPPPPQFPTYFCQAAVDQLGQRAFAPLTLGGGSSNTPRNYSLAQYSVDGDWRRGFNALQRTVELPFVSVPGYELRRSPFNLVWWQRQGVVLVANSLNGTDSDYQLWSVAPSAEPPVQTLLWSAPRREQFFGACAALNRSSSTLYLLQQAPSLRLCALELLRRPVTADCLPVSAFLPDVQFLGVGVAYGALHAVYRQHGYEAVFYGLLDTATGSLSVVAELLQTVDPVHVLVSEERNELVLLPGFARLTSFQLFTGALVANVSVYPQSGATFAAVGLAMTAAASHPHLALSPPAAASNAALLPASNGWLLGTTAALVKYSFVGAWQWQLPVAGLLTDPQMLAVAGKGDTAFWSPVPPTLGAFASLSAARIDGAAPTVVASQSLSFDLPPGQRAFASHAVVLAAASRDHAVVSVGYSLFDADCGSSCRGYGVAVVYSCSTIGERALSCSSHVVNNTLSTSQALSGNGDTYFIALAASIDIYRTSPSLVPLLSLNLRSLGDVGVVATSAASFSGGLSVFGLSRGYTLFLVGRSNGFSETLLSNVGYLPVSCAVNENLAVVASVGASASLQYNVTFYRKPLAGDVQLVAEFSPFPGALPSGFQFTPTKVSLSVDGRFAIVAGGSPIGPNVLVFDLASIDDTARTVAPPRFHYLPGRVDSLQIGRPLEVGLTPVATVNSQEYPRVNYALGIFV